MIPSRHTAFHTWFISGFTRRGLKKHFHSVTVHGGFVEQGKPLLIIGNHFSWWDGFFIYYLNDRYFHRKFHVMMLEDQLRKNPILNKVGAFSIRKNSRSVVESLHYGRTVLEEGSQNLLLFFPQGEIQSLYKQPVVFQKGLERVMKGLEDTVSIWFVANLTDYFSHKKPELHIYMDAYTRKGPFDIKTLEADYNHFLTESKSKQLPQQ